MSEKKFTKTSYADAGVSIERGNTLVDRIKPFTKRTLRPEVMGNIGGFGGLFDISGMDYKNPVLVSGTDGVGTKINLAIETNHHDTIGIDLVAMCVNDLLVSGAEPLFFLDYFACSQLDVDIAERVIKGIAEGCSIAGCSLIGGETAEMPGMYRPGEYDLAGFCVGIVEQSEIIDGTGIEPDDLIIGLSSSSPHANGYSLIRKILKDTGTDLNETVGKALLIENLLAPTRIYVNSIRQLIKKIRIKGMAHITGGGFLENIPRILPEDTSAVIKRKTWAWPEIFHWLQVKGNIDEMEMYRTFNCGVGMILIVNKNDVDTAIEVLESNSENAWVIGNIQKQEISDKKVIFE